MYKRILVPLENGPADAAILTHVRSLAKLLGAEVLLLHVADGRAGEGRFNRDGDARALVAERRGSWHHRDSIATRQPDSDPDGARACSRDLRIALKRRSRASRRNSTFPL